MHDPSFGALQQRVEEEKRIDWETLYHHLKTDFQDKGGELVRQMLSRSCLLYTSRCV